MQIVIDAHWKRGKVYRYSFNSFIISYRATGQQFSVKFVFIGIFFSFYFPLSFWIVTKISISNRVHHEWQPTTSITYNTRFIRSTENLINILLCRHTRLCHNQIVIILYINIYIYRHMIAPTPHTHTRTQIVITWCTIYFFQHIPLREHRTNFVGVLYYIGTALLNIYILNRYIYTVTDISVLLLYYIIFFLYFDFFIFSCFRSSSIRRKCGIHCLSVSDIGG